VSRMSNVLDLSEIAPPAAAGAAARLSFRMLRGREGLLALRAEWQQLLETMESPAFYQRYEWYESLLDAWSELADEVYFFVAYHGGRAAAICPLQRTVSRKLGVPLRTLSPPDPNHLAYSNFVSGPFAESAGVVEALVDELRSGRQPIGWDVLHLPRVIEASSAGDAPVRRPIPGSFRQARERCFYFRTDAGITPIEAKIPKGMRTKLRQARRKLGDIGKVERHIVRDPALLPGALDEFLELEASGWKGAAHEGTAIKLHPPVLAFFRQLTESFGRTGRCEVNLLRCGDRNVAGRFALRSGGVWNQVKIAYDEEFHRYSPGNLLLESALQRLCDDPQIHTASLVTGAAWAEQWNADSWEVSRLVVRNRTIVGRLALLEVQARRLVRERVMPRLARLSRSAGKQSE
jgi:CelD/BcsL family acetyltransferase involved in cellulose biosynthesis